MDEQNSWCLPGLTVLQGKYRIDGVLGCGGFGITYCGTEVRIGLRIAIKEYYPHGFVLRSTDKSPDVSAKPDAVSQFVFESGKQSFLDEARNLAQCERIASIVGVRDYFEENQTAYIVMEYLDGITLKRYLETNGPMEPLRLCRMMLPLIRDLGRVHRLGLLHRDISPDNIMLVEGERLRLMDFGAARNFGEDAGKSMTILLKQGYAPFEQYMRHGNQGPWTDVYALGATMYVCTTGVEPDAATDRVMEDGLVRPSALGVRIAPPVEQVILKSMSVQADRRYQSADEMADALEAAVRCAMLGDGQNSGVTSIEACPDSGRAPTPGAVRTVLEPEVESPAVSPAAPHPVPPDVPPPSPPPERPAEQEAPGSRRRSMVVLCAAVAVVLAIAGFALWSWVGADKQGEAVGNKAPADNTRNTAVIELSAQPTATATPTPTATQTPTATPTPTPTPIPTPTPRVILPNDLVELGRYDYDGNHENGAEPVEWRVLAVDSGKALLISKHVLEQINFHSVKEEISWADSSLRGWLNGTFLQTVFDDDERAAILLTSNTNDKSEGVPEKSTGGSATQDYVFLLSYKEAVRYFKDNQDRIAYTCLPGGTDGDIKPWWLRSISETRKGTAVVERDGRCTATRAVVYENIYVRPSMWVSIDLLP